MRILGINAYHGDASAALVRDGELLCAVEEERLNRIKHWAGFPAEAIRACLNEGGAEPPEHIALSRDPRAHWWRKLLHVVRQPGKWDRTAQRVTNNVRVLQSSRPLRRILPGLDRRVRIHHVEHHRAHLASAFFVSPFEEAAVVSIDGFGDFSSIMWGVGRGNRIEVRDATIFPHSLGIFYTAFTQYLGFPKYGDEYKLMGLAAYGEPRYREQVAHVVATAGGQPRLNLDYFTHHRDGVAMTWDGGEPVIGPIYSRVMCDTFGPPRQPRTEIEPRHADLAASVQAVLEDNYFALLNHVYSHTRQKNLCLAGGVALNCAANGKILDRTPFQHVFIQPAAADNGTSIGAAYHVHNQVLGNPRSFQMHHAYLGPQHATGSIGADLRQAGAEFEVLEEQRLVERTAQAIAAGKIVGWFQGRMEFGPRALGNRSILADPRNPAMKEVLNRRIKYREPFRPFCPSVLAEAVADYFEPGLPAPFMVTAFRIRPEQRDRIPAVTHADGTGRLQTVQKEVNPLYWRLIHHFGEITGVPVLLNTSFNENEPIVNTPRQAIDCFLRTQMDVLVLGRHFLVKSENRAQAQATGEGAGSEFSAETAAARVRTAGGGL